jgi:hypothetical protein
MTVTTTELNYQEDQQFVLLLKPFLIPEEALNLTPFVLYTL